MYKVSIGNNEYTFRQADKNDKQQIMTMYRSAIGTEGCTWSEEYPNEDICDTDIDKDNLFCMENESGVIVGAISIDSDEEVDALKCWNNKAGKMAEIARLVIKKEYQNMGLAPEMIKNTVKVLKSRGYKTVHYLVSKFNKKALASYEKLEFDCVGESDILHNEWFCYELNIEKGETEKNYKIFTIPNILSFLRLILAGLFLALYSNTGSIRDNVWAIVVLILSGITDLFDGRIARKYNMISELGKILDPIADKVTEAVIAICLVTKYKILIILLAVFVIKEIFMSICGIFVLRKTKQNDGAKWYGKVSTFSFYVIMIALLIIPGIDRGIANLMIIICTFIMAFAFVMYSRLYYKIFKN